jgi:lysozyme family protein
MTFDDAFAFTVGEEGGLSMEPSDPGNWTGGKVGAGQLKGTKYGVSAKAYPDEDIANLTLDRAKLLFKRDYWDRVSGDNLSPVVAFGLFDTAVNEGVDGSLVLAQKALGLGADGVLGPHTLAALQAVAPTKFARQFSLMRVIAYSGMALWPTEKNGWVGRVLDVYSRMIT